MNAGYHQRGRAMREIRSTNEYRIDAARPSNGCEVLEAKRGLNLSNHAYLTIRALSTIIRP